MVNLELKNLLNKYMTGDCTVTERARLAELVALPESNEAALDEFVREVMTSDAYAGADDPHVKQALLKHLEKHMRPVRKMPMWRYAAAAAIIVLLLGGVWYWRSTSRPVGPVVAQQPIHDVPPGQEGVIITLANGSQIVLDSSNAGSNGNLAKQGNVMVTRLGAGQLIYRIDDAPPVTSEAVYNTLTTPRGRKTSVVLSDGTRVWLNAASSIRFPTDFVGRERKVEVSGEVYFEVAKNAGQPFIVKTISTAGRTPLEVQVLGTSFNITAYPDEATVSTTLTEGSVNVINSHGARLMTPGQQLVSTGNGGMELNPGVDVQKVIAWKDDVFLFKKDELPAIMKQLSRWYDIEVHFDGNVSDHYTGKISRQVNISQVLKMLQAAGGVKFSVQEKEVRVLPSAM